MQGWDLRITKSSVNLIKEMRNYTWAKDRDGNSTNTPIDMWNHGADAMRYALYSEFGDSASGQYVIGFRNRPHSKDKRYERERNHR
jgi:phage terminase large subunit